MKEGGSVHDCYALFLKIESLGMYVWLVISWRELL